jgi:hypothetical protein
VLARVNHTAAKEEAPEEEVVNKFSWNSDLRHVPTLTSSV